MKNNIIKHLACAAMALGLAATVQATPINGAITFNGTVTLDTGNALSATAVTGWHDNSGIGLPVVASRSLDFATYVTAGDAVTFAAPWSFNSAALTPFWQVDGFTFDLTSSAIQFQGGSPGSVDVGGIGTISGHGFTSTSGTWSFSTQNPPAGTIGTPPLAIFSFSASSGALPDGGTTAMLLGAALSGLALIRRKLA